MLESVGNREPAPDSLGRSIKGKHAGDWSRCDHQRGGMRFNNSFHFTYHTLGEMQCNETGE